MTTISQEVKKQVTGARVDLFEIDLSPISGSSAESIRMTSSSDATIVFNGQSYLPWAIAIDGIESFSDGAYARPRLSIGNLDQNKLIGALAFTYGDIVGAKVIYTRLVGGLSLPPIFYKVRKKVMHNRNSIVFELGSVLDTERGFLPKRMMLKKDFPGIGTNKGGR